MRSWIHWLTAAVRAAGWAPTAVFAAHIAASRVLGTYQLFPQLDIPMHLLGGSAIAYFFQRSLQVGECRPVVGALTATAARLLSLAATGTTTVVWELAEWLSDRCLGTHAQLGLDDTLLDMLLGIAGGLVLSVMSAPVFDRRRGPPIGEMKPTAGLARLSQQDRSTCGGTSMPRKTMHRSLIIAALLTLAITTLAAADYRIERELAMGADGTFELDTDSGAIEVRGVDRSGARIVVTAKRDDVEERFDFSFEERGDDAVVTVDKRGSWTSWFKNGGDRLHFAVEVQRDADLDLQTSGGSVEVESIDGRVELHTSGGSVRVSEVGGDLVAKTSGGSVRAEKIGGDAVVESSGGSLEVYDVAGQIEAHTSGGSVEARFTAGNASGGTLSTSGGGITAIVDPAVALDIDAHTSGGRINSDLPLTVRGDSSRTKLQGQLNGGGPMLKLRTSGGSIRLRGV